MRKPTPVPPQPRRIDPAIAGMVLLGMMIALSGHAGLTAPGLTLALLSLFVATVVLAFARRQLRADLQRSLFTRLAAGLVLATLVMALATDAILLAAGWIVTGRLMGGLIGYSGGRPDADAAARLATPVFMLSDLALVAALAILAIGAETTTLAGILAQAPALPPAWLALAAILLAIAAAGRCAIPPFSGWLMGSLAAPTPVSALMHAGFVNAGGFLLVRFAPILEAAPVVRGVLFGVALAGALTGCVLVLVRNDVKGALAASTVAQMGFMLATVALGAYAAALWHMVAHGLFKSWLFLGSSGTIATAGGRRAALPTAQAWAVVTLTVGGMTALLITDAGPAISTAVLPIGLGLAALLVSVTLGLGLLRRTRFGLAVLIIPAVLVAANAGALAGLSQYQPAATAPLLSPLAQLLLLALLLGLWAWQQGLAHGVGRLPPRLTARLMHIGTPPHPASALKD